MEVTEGSIGNNAVQIFEYNSQQVRTVTINGEAWFVGKDAAEILGYSNVNKAVTAHVDEEDRKTLEYTGFSQNGKSLWEGNDYSTKTIINESGLYSLILSSKLPNAKKFKHWVTSEVLPSIRKHGLYATPQMAEAILNDPDIFIRVLQELKAERLRVKALEVKIAENKPKVLFADAVDASKDSILVGNLAKILRQNGVDIGQNRLFAWLQEHGYLIGCKGERHNMPTQRSIDLELFEVKKVVINNPDGSNKITHTTKVTGKGQIYFINKFLAERTEQ